MTGISTYVMGFRIIHILAGTFWAGSAVLFAFFVQPTAASLGPAAAPFLNEFMTKRKAMRWIVVAATFTVVAGLFLYWRAWHDLGSFGTWIGSAPGKVLTIGGAAAIFAYFFAIQGTVPTFKKMSALGKQVAATGGPPTPEQGAEMGKLGAKLRLYARATAIFLIVAVFCMATAREWGPGL
jgi:hypothetical protein